MTVISRQSIPPGPRSGPPSGGPPPGVFSGNSTRGPPGAGLPGSDNGPGTVTVVWLLFALATVFMCLRLFCKIFRSRGLWWDDWVLIASWVAFAVDASMVQTVVSLGFGKYPWNIKSENVTPIGLAANFGMMFGVLAVVLSKTSFGLTILRLTQGHLKRLVWAILVSMNLAMGLHVIFVWTHCVPSRATWDRSVEGVCWSDDAFTAYGVFSGVLSGICDLLLAVLPWRVLWGLKMNKREKLGVGVAMSMGAVAGATAFAKSAAIPSLKGPEFTHDGTILLVWASAEIATTIMAACIPVLRVLVRESHRSIKGFTDRSGPSAAGAGGAGAGAGSKQQSSSRSRTNPSTSAVAVQQQQPVRSSFIRLSSSSSEPSAAAPIHYHHHDTQTKGDIESLTVLGGDTKPARAEPVSSWGKAKGEDYELGERPRKPGPTITVEDDWSDRSILSLQTAPNTPLGSQLDGRGHHPAIEQREGGGTLPLRLPRGRIMQTREFAVEVTSRESPSPASGGGHRGVYNNSNDRREAGGGGGVIGMAA